MTLTREQLAAIHTRKRSAGISSRFDREQRKEFAELEQIRRTDPKRFREIQLREGTFDDVLTIDEINEELRKLKNDS